MQKSLRNRIIALSLALAFIVALIVSFSILGNARFNVAEGYSETFKGSVSKNVYATKEAAARAFVSEEITGEGASFEYVGYTKTGDLTEDELAEINAQRLSADDFLSGEKVTIEYRSAEKEGAVKAYLLNTARRCRYYVLPPESGEQVTNAYLNSVLDGAKYLNCTATSTFSLNISEVMTTYRQVIKFDDDKAYFKQEVPGLISDLYLKEVSDGISVYLKHPEIHDGKFYSLSEINSYYFEKKLKYEPYLQKGGERILIENLGSMQEVTDFAFTTIADASYFTKTTNGFEMNDDQFKAFCKMILGSAFEESFEKSLDDYKVHFHSDFYVSEGRLSRNKTVLSLLYDDNFMTIAIDSVYSDFAATEVEIPER